MTKTLTREELDTIRGAIAAYGNTEETAAAIVRRIDIIQTAAVMLAGALSATALYRDQHPEAVFERFCKTAEACCDN